MNREKKLEAIAYNAIGFMLENNMNNSELSTKELCEEIADYLGFDVDELIELGVLERDLYYSGEFTRLEGKTLIINKATLAKYGVSLVIDENA